MGGFFVWKSLPFDRRKNDLMLDRTSERNWRLQPAWIVVQAEHRQERTARHSLKEQGLVTYLPEYSATIRASSRVTLRARGQRVRTVVRPLFPGYLFARVIIADRSTWLPIFRCKGVKGVLVVGEEPGRVPDAVIDEIQGLDNCGVSATASELAFVEGMQVRIEEGPFASFPAVVEAIRKAAAGSDPEVDCLVDLFGRQTRIVVSASQLGRP